MKTIFTLTIFEMLLLEGGSVLRPAKQVPGSERVKYSFRSDFPEKF